MKQVLPILMFCTAIWCLPALAETAYLDVNFTPTKVKINRTFYYSTNSQANAKGIHTIAVYNMRDERVATLHSRAPTIGPGTLIGRQVAETREGYRISRLIYHYNDGFTGEIVKRNSDGYLKEVAPYKNGKQHGVKKTYYSSGAVGSATPYKDGVKVLSAKTWSEAGQLISETERSETGKFIRKRKWTAEGKLLRLIKPVNIPGYGAGLKETAWRYDRTETFVASDVDDPDGRFARGLTYPYKLIEKKRDGKIFERVEQNGSGKNGEQRYFIEGYETVENLKYGERHGEFTETNEGKVTTQGTYKNGIKVGKWQSSNKDGSVVYENFTQTGKLDGSRQVVDKETERLLLSEEYTNGLRNGVFEEFDTQGRRTTYGKYAMGKKVGDWVEHEGTQRWEGNYVQGDRDGTWVQYNKHGYRVAKLSYANGKLEGPQYLFNQEGALTLFESRKNDVRHGARKTYESGHLKTENQFYQGQRQ